MDQDKGKTTGRSSDITDKAMTMDKDEGKGKPTTDIYKTKEFVQSVLNKRRLRLELKQPNSYSAPTSPASNVSEMDLVWDEGEARSIKRRREESRVLQTEEDEGQAPTLAAKTRNIIRLIGKEIREVAEHAKDRNTKKEIKEGSKALVSLISQLQTSEVQVLLQSLGRYIGGKESVDVEMTERLQRLEGEIGELKAENVSLREEISVLATRGGIEHPTKEELAAKVERVVEQNKKLREENARLYNKLSRSGGQYIEEENLAESIYRELEECDGVTKFLEIAKKTWPEGAYKCSTVKRGNLLREEKDIVLYARGGDMTEGVLAGAVERFPELEEMGDHQSPDNISSLVVVTRTRQGEETLQRERTIYKVTPKPSEDRETNEEFLLAMKELQVHLERDGKMEFAMAVPSEMTLEEVRKVMEYALMGTGRKGILYEERALRTERMKPPRKDSGAVIVKVGEKSFTEALKEVKSKIGSEEEGTLKRVRKTQRGDVLLIVKGGADKAKLVEEKIRNTTSMEAQVADRDRKNLFIQGVDGVTTREEIEEAIMKHLGQEGTQGFQVVSMREAMGNNQVATIAATGEIANRLLERGSIIIGWLECPIKERISVTKCYRCLEYGHIRIECKGPDRSRVCYKCGKNGHNVRECEQLNDFCHACQEEGHRNSSTRCPAFRKMLTEARNKGKFGRNNRLKGTPKR